MIRLYYYLGGILKDDNKLELDFGKSIEKKPEARKSYKINNPVNPQVNNYYKKDNQISKREQMEMLKRSHKVQNNSLILRLLVSLGIIGGYYYSVHKYLIPVYGNKIMLHATIALFIYSVIAYFFRPEPDMDNLGYFGGLINRPFDYSDDWNRFLLWLKIFLLPGIIISEAIVDLFQRN